MAVLPSPTQVAGFHSAIYEAYYSQVDPNGHGIIGAMEAARFLKKSGLSDVVLSRIWDLSDPGGRGSLDKAGFFVALKLVALAQAGRDINVSNLSQDLPPPKMGDKLPQISRPNKPPPPSNSPTPLITSLPPSVAGDWSIKPAEREKYDRLFESLQPLNGMIPGNKVKGVLMESKLPVDTLGKIWDLADMDKDGMLDRHEFVVAMHLVYKALEKYAIPNVLPPELMAPSKRKGSSPAPVLLTRGMDGMKPEVPPPPMQAVVHPQPIIMQQQPPVVPIQPVAPIQHQPQPQAAQPAVINQIPQIPWVVATDEKAKFDVLFTKSDIDRDGYVSGLEIKDVFLKSGVPQPILAHIWALCDIKQSGKLNGEQFALAMWLVERCLKGQEPPVSLTPEMVPPSFRNNKADGIVENNNTPYSNPELDMISKDIEELSREKLILETEIAQKEADIKIKSGEIKSLQSELDTLAATLKQLENQKGEAQKRLNDLKAQRSTVDSELEDVDKQLYEQQDKVDKLRSQADEQAEVLKVQEGELTSKKEQLENLKKEEERLEKQRQDNDGQLNRLTTNLQDTQLQISQAKAKITQLQEMQRQMNDAIAVCDGAVETGDASTVADTALRISPEFRSAEYAANNNDTPETQQNGFADNKNDPFSDNTSGQVVNGNSGFQDDPFKADPFKSSTNSTAADAFSSNDPFAASFPSNKADGFSADPFSSFNSNTVPAKADPFDPFSDGKNRNNNNTNPGKSPLEDEKDPFGCDPFAILHAPTRDGSTPGRPSSPSPALPPKKSKQPPPRPAPPRPMQPPRPAAPPSGMKQDPFSADPFASSGGFADFADFDAKFSDKPSTTTSTGPPPTQKNAMDFTDDPFRDYRYEDPFNIADPFDDEPSHTTSTSSISKSADNIDAFSTTTNTNIKKSFDAFGPSSNSSSSFTHATSSTWQTTGLGGRQSVPLPGSHSMSTHLSLFPPNNNNNNSSNNNSNSSGRASAPITTDPFVKSSLPSEDQQLAWAAAESIRLEEQRKKQQLKEEEELEYVLAISKQQDN